MSGPVIFVDDDPDLRRATAQVLSLAGFEVRAFEGAEAALAVLERADPARMTELQKVTWHSEKGRLLDRLGRYGSAFAAFTEAAQALARYRRVVHRPEGEEAAMDGVEAWFARHGADRQKYRHDSHHGPVI